MTKKIYPLIVHDGFGAYYWVEREDKDKINARIQVTKKEEIDKIRNSTYTAVDTILMEEFYRDENTEEIFKVHFEIVKLQDILKNNS